MTSETAISRLYVLLGMKSTLGEDTAKAGAEVKKFEKEVLDASKKVGAGLTAIGGAAILLADNSRQLNADLGQTALQLGVTSDEMRTLALETTNITYPLDDVVSSFDLLARAGMRNTAEMQRTGNAFSDLGTALGYSASELAESLIPAFNAFGVPLEEVEDHIDAFTHLLRNTTVDLSDYASMVNYLAPQLDTMNLSIEDSVAVMEALADKGIQGGAATREFRKAATAAEGDVKKFYEALDLTTDEVEVYAREVRGATGITKEYAAVAETQFGTIDHLKQSWSELSFQIGSAIEPFEGVAVAATALGGILMGLGPALQLASAAKTAYTTVTTAATAATTAFGAALAANPAALAAVAIGAVAISLGAYVFAAREATDASADLNREGKTAIEIAKEKVRAKEIDIEKTKTQIEWHRQMRDQYTDLGGALNRLSAQYHQSRIDEYTEEVETLTGKLGELKDKVIDLEDAEIRLDMAQSQHDVSTLESSLSNILGLMDELAGEERTRAELEDKEAIQEIRVRTSQKDLDDARAALKAWEKGGDTVFALEFGASAGREEHQRLIDAVTKAQVDLNRATRDHEDTLEEIAGLTEHYNDLNEEMAGAVADVNTQFGDLNLTLDDVAKGMDHVTKLFEDFIAATPAGQEKLRQIALLFGEDVETPSYVPVISGGFYGKGFSQDTAEFEVTEGGGMQRVPAGDRETIPTATSVVARYAIEPLPAIEVDEPDPVVVDVEYAVDPLPASEVDRPDPVTVGIRYEVESLPLIKIDQPDPVLVEAGYAVEPLPAIEVDRPDPVMIEALYVGIGIDALQAETKLNEIREIRNQLDSDAALTSTELYDIYVQIEEQIPEIGAVHGTTVDGMIWKLDEYIRRQEIAIEYLGTLGSVPHPDADGLVRRPTPQTTLSTIPINQEETLEARYPTPPPVPAFEVEPISSTVLISETKLNEIREIRNDLDSGAIQATADLLTLYEQVQEELPEIGDIHDLTITGMVGKLDEYIRRQEVAIANMRELSSGGSTVMVRTGNDQPERSAATGMPYVPRDMNVRVHQGEAIVPASQAAGRSVTVNINGPVIRDDRDIDLLANALYRRLQRA